MRLRPRGFIPPGPAGGAPAPIDEPALRAAAPPPGDPSQDGHAPPYDAPMYDLIELFYFAYRQFVGDADRLLEVYSFGRAHHRVLHFVSRHPGLTIAALLDILAITKQSLNRVLKELIAQSFIEARAGAQDRRHRQLYVTIEGENLAHDLASAQTQRFSCAMRGLGPEGKARAEAFLLAMIDAADRDRIVDLIGAPIAGRRVGRRESGS